MQRVREFGELGRSVHINMTTCQIHSDTLRRQKRSAHVGRLAHAHGRRVRAGLGCVAGAREDARGRGMWYVDAPMAIV